MSGPSPKNIEEFLLSQRNKATLRFITCGSVDDGKSTLIGRLLFDSKSIFDDQLAAIERDSRIYGTQGERVDLALLVDGLQAEREQGITIDVAYRFFATNKRRYIVADTPGHEQYTRNMATGASCADVAVILIDASKGVVEQTRRHTRIASLMGIKHIVLAVNKMDLVSFDQSVFRETEAFFRSFASNLDFSAIVAMPICALDGDNVLHASLRTPWFEGPTLMSYLDSLDLMDSSASRSTNAAMRLPIQWVNRPNPSFRGICGRLAAGTICSDDALRVLPSGMITKVERIYRGFEQVAQASAGDSVTVVLADDVDASRGDVLVSLDGAPEVADQFEIRLIWMHESPLSPGRQFFIKLGYKEVSASITDIKYREDINTGAQLAAKVLGMNEIGVVNISTSAPIVFEPYANNRMLGGLIFIDKFSFDTVGAGMINFALRRSHNIHWQAVDINKRSRSAMMQQTPRCIWFTGLSGSGKSTIANRLETRLYQSGRYTYLLDGDNVRQGLSRDLGFTESDRIENIRRVAEVAKLMVDAGLIVLVSFISPFRSERLMARQLFSEEEFLEVFIDTPLHECERRDTKGLYAKARRGDLKNFTGIDSPYEAPEAPDVWVATSGRSVEQCVDDIWRRLEPT